MADRILRAKALSSESLDRLNPAAEVLFYRLLMVADDYGRFEADPRLLLARCFPLRVDKMRATELEARLDPLLEPGPRGAEPIIRLYKTDGRTYGYFVTWRKHNTPRAKASKFPEPPDPVDTCEHVQTSTDTRKQIRSDSDSDSDSDSKADCAGANVENVDNFGTVPDSSASASVRGEPDRGNGGEPEAPRQTGPPGGLTDEQTEALDHLRRRIQASAKLRSQAEAIDRVLMAQLRDGAGFEALAQGLRSVIANADTIRGSPAAYLAKILRVEVPNEHERKAVERGKGFATPAGMLQGLMAAAKLAAEKGGKA